MWHILGIKPTTNLKEIKSAYAKLAKQYNPEENPEEFQKIFNAYKFACSYAKRHRSIENPDNKSVETDAISNFSSSEHYIRNTNDTLDFSAIDPYKKYNTPQPPNEDKFDFSDISISQQNTISEETSDESNFNFPETIDTQEDVFDFSKVNDKYDESDEQRRIINLRIDLTNRLRKLACNGTIDEWNSFFENTYFAELSNDFEFRTEASKILNGRPLKKDIAQLITRKFTNSIATTMNYARGIYQVFIAVNNQQIIPKSKTPSVFLITVIIVLLTFVLILGFIITTDSNINSESSSTAASAKQSKDFITLRPYEENDNVNEYLLDAIVEVSENTKFSTDSLYNLCIGKWNFEFGYIEFFNDSTFKCSFNEEEIVGNIISVPAETGPELTIFFSAPNTSMDGSKATARFFMKTTEPLHSHILMEKLQ